MRTIKLLQNNQTVNTIALITVISLLMWTVGIHNAQADGISEFSDTLTDSDVLATANHTIVFTTATGVPDGNVIDITFQSDFNLSNVTEDDVDVSGSTAGELTTEASCTTEDAGVAVAGQILSITLCGNGASFATDEVITVEIGDNATASGTGSSANRIVNPSSEGSYTIDVDTDSAGEGDTGQTRVFIIENIDMTATVETTFTFTITGVAADADGANSETVTTKMATSATAIPWGTIEAETPYSAAHTLSVGTNASNGFAVTLEQDSDLTNANTDTIDLFIDGAATGSPAAWQSPAATLDDFDTYGHYGVTSSDNTLSGGDEFGTALYAGDIDSPRLVFDHDGPADGQINGTGTPHAGNAAIGYKIEISPLQEAGDYSNVLTYIATPTF